MTGVGFVSRLCWSNIERGELEVTGHERAVSLLEKSGAIVHKNVVRAILASLSRDQH